MKEGPSGGGDRLVKEDRVSFKQQPVTIPVGELPPRKQRVAAVEAGAQVEVETVRADDGTVKQITVHCSCGREITLQCEYSDQGEQDGKETS